MTEIKELGAHVYELDVTSEESVEAMYKSVSQILGDSGLDYLFNNAGVSCTFPASDLKLKDAQDCFEVNFFGVVRCTKIFLPLLRLAQGTIVQTSSIAAVTSFPFASIYSASKAALCAYSNVLRVELIPFKVKVVTIMAAAVGTEISDTRPLPKDSLYLEIDEGVDLRRALAKGTVSMTATYFAQSVIKEIVVKKTTKYEIWEGKGWLLFWAFAYVVPNWFFERMAGKKFLLNQLTVPKKKSD